MIPANSRFVRSSLAVLLLVGALYPSQAFAQSTGDLEAFRARLAAFMRDLEEVHVLTGIHPAGAPSAGEAAAPDLATLSYDDLAKLMQSYPNDPKFWDAPRKLLDMLKRVNPSAFNTHGVSTPMSRGREMMTALARWPDRSARRSRLSDEDVSILMRAYASGRPAQRAPQTVLAALHQTYRVDDDVFGRADGLDIVRRTPPARSATAAVGAGVTLTTVAAAEATADPVTCPAGFDYEALWIARDAEMVADIAMEIIPEDALTSPAYIVAAVAWSALKVTLFAVEQVYERWDDCESANVFAQVDASISSRATQASVDSLKSGLSAIQSGISDIPGAIAEQSASLQAGLAVFQSVLGAQSLTTTYSLNTLIGRIDNLAAMSASGDAVNDLSTMVSSTVPRKLGPSGPITVYTAPNFGGTSKLFQGNESRFELECMATPYLQGIKSVRVPAGTTVTFYAFCNYQGASATFTADDADLSDNKLQTFSTFEFPAASMRIIQTQVPFPDTIASQASVDTLKSKIDALDLSGSGALATKIDALASNIAAVGDRVGAVDLSKLDVGVSTRASQASIDQVAATLATRASQGSVDAAAASIIAALQQRFDDLASREVAQPLQIQVVELSPKDRYLVYVTDAGRAAGGATLSKVQAINRHPKGNVSIADITATVIVTEMAPGVLELRVPKSDKLDGLIVSVAQGSGAAARAASIVVRETKRED